MKPLSASAPLLLCLMLPALAGCNRVENRFTIDDPEGRIASAQIQLCGSTTKLDQTGNRFTASQAITCEGEGDILVQLADTQEISCHIGYVTPGAEDEFKFEIKDSQCEPKGTL